MLPQPFFFSNSSGSGVQPRFLVASIVKIKEFCGQGDSPHLPMPAYALVHVAVGLLVAHTVLAESRDDATGVALMFVSMDKAVVEVSELSAQAGQRLPDTCKRRVVGLFHGGQRRVEVVV